MRNSRAQYEQQQAAVAGRLLARPKQPDAPAAPGLHPLGLSTQRDGLLYVPSGYRADQPAPLALLFHGAGGTAEHGIGLLHSYADQTGIILLAPQSRQQTWDIIVDHYGPDIAFIDRALTQTFSRYAVDPRYIAVSGFSDGASYALSVGITNGDLFPQIIAFSPGFLAPADQIGAPRMFISHGTQDTVLPIDKCSRRIVPKIQKVGYSVEYREFEGPHTIPPDIAQAAVEWFLAARN